MKANHDQLVYDIICYQPSVILLSETRTTSDIEDFEIEIDGYNIVRCDSSSRHTGGVVIYVRKEYVYRTYKKVCIDKIYWCLLLKIKIHGENVILGCLYRSPNSNVHDFFDHYEIWAEKLFNEECRCILVGDFNLNFFNRIDRNVQQFHNFITINGVEQLINEPTRVTNTSSSLIDYVLSNRNDCFCKVHNTPKITDHSVISVSIRTTSTITDDDSIRKFRNFSKKNLELLNSKLIFCDWNLDSVDVDVIFHNIMENIESQVEIVSPLITYKIRKNQLPWYDHDVVELSKARDLAYRAFRENSDLNQKQINWAIYKNCRNEVVNLLKQKKIDYHKTKIDNCSQNPKRMWKTLKTLIKPKNPSIPKQIIFETDGRTAKGISDENKADMFNSFFINSIIAIRDGIPPSIPWSNHNLPIIECSLSTFKLLALKELKSIINSLDNRCNSDIINNKVLKNIFDVIGPIILNLVNTSLETGAFPQKLKISTVIPIPKIANTNEASNFRPINTLPCLEKILELAAYTQVQKYINDNHLLMEYQSGFRPNHSCETALQVTLSKWKIDIDANKYVVAVFLDFKRAFETIDIPTLLLKLRYYGISGKVYNWFESYLVNRTQRTKVNNTFSTNKCINTGVPQGSVLGPLLFILYLNDINYIQECEFINLFADDALLTASDVSLPNAINKINRTLQRVSEFLDINKLKLNINKTKCMIVTTQHKYNLIDKNVINIQIYGETIELVEEFKYLGFMLDNQLNLKKHFHYIYNKISKKIFFFTRISRSLTFQTSITVYNTIIKPHFDYCSSLLFLLDANSISSLQKLQNRGMRVLLRCNRHTSIMSMLQVLDWLSVKDRLFYNSMIFIYKLISGKLPTYFNQFVVYQNEIHDYPTRGNMNFYVARTNYTRSMNSLFHKGLREYNELPRDIKNSSSIVQFKRSLVEYLKSK